MPRACPVRFARKMGCTRSRKKAESNVEAEEGLEGSWAGCAAKTNISNIKSSRTVSLYSKRCKFPRPSESRLRSSRRLPAKTDRSRLQQCRGENNTPERAGLF